MDDIDAVLRDMTETEDDIAGLALSDKFRDELSRIRQDLKVSPFVPLTDDMCKWVILAYLRSSYMAPPRRKTLTDDEIFNASLRLFVKAVAFAADKHRNQRRKDADASPYINHPIALANVLANEGGVSDVMVLCAALLHDTIEDTETTPEELTAVFGPTVTATVLDVTDDKSLDKHVRKQRQIERAPHISKEAKLVKLADKICNLRDILASPPADWSHDRKKGYFDLAAKVIVGVRGVHPELEAIFNGLLERHAELRTGTT